MEGDIMLEFFKNLFRRKKKIVKVDTEQYTYDEDIIVTINRNAGVIKIEAPTERDLSKDEIIEICKKFAEGEM